MVMLEWGSCGQMAVECGPASGDVDRVDRPTMTRRASGTRSTRRRGRCRARGCFPTGPVSADAVLLTSLGVESAADVRRAAAKPDGGGRRRIWFDAVCGRWRRSAAPQEAAELVDPRLVPPELRPVVEVLGDCSVDQCIIDADFLDRRRVRRRRAAPVLPAAAARAGAGPGLEGRGRGGVGATAGECRSCSSRSARARVPAERRLAWAGAAGLFDRQLVREQFGEGERAGGAVVLAEQVEPLDRGEDALGDRVAGLAWTPAARGRADW